MDGLLNVLVYKCFLDVMREQKDTLPEEAQAGFTIVEQALEDAIRYRKTEFDLDILIKKLYEESKCVIIMGERYYSIDIIKNILKELKGGEEESCEEKAQESITFDARISDEIDIDSIRSIINDLLYGGDDEEDKGNNE